MEGATVDRHQRAERKALQAQNQTTRDYIWYRMLKLLQESGSLPVGPHRDAVLDKYDILTEAKHILSPDPCYLEDRRALQRHETRDVTKRRRGPTR